MPKSRKVTAALAAAALVAAPVTMIAGPAHADGPEQKREFRLAGADVDFKVEKDDGRFDVEVSIDRARPGSRWRVVLRHDGRVFVNTVRRADRDGEIDIDRFHRDTAGADVFKVRVKKVGGGAKERTIRMR
ncbi:hypothetical protein [Nocardioides sp. cx-173]|uniref:hypothetical protein n=1 Tax=Nocardioides sp. cx-173 TaxID=2898796 RepID=UPI001E4D905D|nr:hypothetical protein [Nocardioides sp. cx-173]MCD4524725.1 hypothetical protein [Nocardioides sp. cx-173]UGB43235.1 hypothetical protein LQ940_06815 [Nocardioides sp. cx-173]